ncbi:ssDNA binding protein [Synechococcus phage S-ShM2]|uniref:Single-stranded DNA-binding protein n=3 Tax=Ahtivirus sagseatwo TaxID=2734079 RepID=A0A1D7SHM6_9CAUD|nr:ssDNA binding protein [Synechococcus phage S-ShM2]AGH57336.1 single-stranded DNA binding protein [Cyanophage S-SSM2]AOO13117.1 single-stranded DNA binding protein [Cyanophage S-RIM14]ADO97614.1 ssDNA binding protein [Synechococcus phage S-ShM2]AOO13333.1 single-stranded DNA binding protein [Cyanophage S-RIM14]AOO13549.1 single-stranded DNA binding protein [Cyanophage S-RIM14]
MSFASLKKSSGNNFAKLTAEIEKINQPQGSGADDRLWKPELDKAGNSYAVIRFLPAPDGEDMPFAKVWSHAFKGPGGWYIENSLTTVGKKDPVGELNRELWNSGVESDKEIARKQKRKLSYYANIYVVSDPSRPQNEGRVFLYKFGKKIFDKIVEAMQPQFADETPVDPFDLWKGADFKLKIRQVEGYWNYDKSEFSDPSTLGDLSDDDLEKVWKQEFALADFTSPSAFKTYEELQQRLASVLSTSPARPRFDAETEENEQQSFGGSPAQRFGSSTPAETQAPNWAEEVSTFREKATAVAPSTTDTDDTLSYFARLAEED